MPDPYWTPAMLVGLGVIVGSVAWVSWYGIAGRMQFVGWFVAIVLFFAFPKWMLERRARGRIRAIAADKAGEPIDAVFAAIKDDRRTWGARAEFQSIQRETARRGRNPEVVCIHGESKPWLPHGLPLEIEFEPRKLDEADEGFRALQFAVGAADGSGESKSNREGRQRAALSAGVGIVDFGRRFLNTRIGAEGFWLFLLVMILLSSGNLRRMFAPSNYVQLAMTTVLAGMLVISLLRIGTRQQLLIPAGLYSRRCGVFSRRWTRHLFTAKTAALWLIDSGENETISVVAADTDECVQFSLTRAEAEILVRGWLSPLAPPELERLSDLA